MLVFETFIQLIQSKSQFLLQPEGEIGTSKRKKR